PKARRSRSPRFRPPTPSRSKRVSTNLPVALIYPSQQTPIGITKGFDTMPIKVGDRLPPDIKFRVMGPEGPAVKTVEEVFKGKKVVLFAVPGAFTPTCNNNHLPGFVKNAASIKGTGIDSIAVTGVNDVFVMNAWKKASNADAIE